MNQAIKHSSLAILYNLVRMRPFYCRHISLLPFYTQEMLKAKKAQKITEVVSMGKINFFNQSFYSCPSQIPMVKEPFI